MAKLLLAFILSFNLYALDTIIISDLDDTIKRTNAGSTIPAGINALFTRKVFPGIPELFKTLESEVNGLYVLSNSPHIFRLNICRLMKKYNLNPDHVQTRSLIKNKDKFKYKYDYIVKKIISTNSKAILMGDDVGEDPEVYAKVLKNYPEHVAGIYIHVIKNREVPSVVTKIHSFLDIALSEYKSERLNFSQLSVMVNRFNSIKKFKKLFPKFKHCPRSSWRSETAGEIVDIVNNMTNTVIKFCKNR